MRVDRTRVFLIAAFGLIWLTGCETTSSTSDPPTPDTLSQTPATAPDSTGAVPDVTGGVSVAQGSGAASPEMLGNDSKDDLALGKKYYRLAAYGRAEEHFRKAVELHPRNAEAWIGLAAAYDRLRRFDLADRAYQHVTKLIGPTAEVLNNQGYSYLLRGDYRRARVTLKAAQAMSPDNPFIKSNLDLLAESQRKAKTVN